MCYNAIKVIFFCPSFSVSTNGKMSFSLQKVQGGIPDVWDPRMNPYSRWSEKRDLGFNQQRPRWPDVIGHEAPEETDIGKKGSQFTLQGTLRFGPISVGHRPVTVYVLLYFSVFDMPSRTRSKHAWLGVEAWSSLTSLNYSPSLYNLPRTFQFPGTLLFGPPPKNLALVILFYHTLSYLGPRSSLSNGRTVSEKKQ